MTRTGINPTTPEKQVAAFASELDRLLYRFGCEFDIEPEDYAATLIQAADDILVYAGEDDRPQFHCRFIDGPMAGELMELTFPEGYTDEPTLYWEVSGTAYTLHRLASGMWQGYEL